MDFMQILILLMDGFTIVILMIRQLIRLVNFQPKLTDRLWFNQYADMENDPDITLHFFEKGTISKFYTVDGEDFNPHDDSGVWLDKRFADERNLKVGDKILLNLII